MSAPSSPSSSAARDGEDGELEDMLVDSENITSSSDNTYMKTIDAFANSVSGDITKGFVSNVSLIFVDIRASYSLIVIDYCKSILSGI